MNVGNLTRINPEYINEVSNLSRVSNQNNEDFGSIFDSMINSLNETNTLHNKAEEAEIQFALGESENTHDLLVAQTKATVALQYTVAVRDKLLDSYRELMQMQI